VRCAVCGVWCAVCGVRCACTPGTTRRETSWVVTCGALGGVEIDTKFLGILGRHASQICSRLQVKAFQAGVQTQWHMERIAREAAAGAGNGFRLRALFKGLLPVLGCGTAPTFATFFAIYQPLKDDLSGRCSHECCALIASVAAGIPASFISVPADVMKKRLVLGVATVFARALRHICHVNIVTERESRWQHPRAR